MRFGLFAAAALFIASPALAETCYRSASDKASTLTHLGGNDWLLKQGKHTTSLQEGSAGTGVNARILFDINTSEGKTVRFSANGLVLDGNKFVKGCK